MQQQREPTNILVTGGAGFIGSSFIRFLLEKEQVKGAVVNVDLLTYAADLQYLEEVAKRPNYTFYQVDINEQKKITALCHKHNIDTIVHFAAETHVDNSITMPEAFLRANVEGTFALLEVVRKNPKIHFHHISTDEVFGSLGKSGSFTELSPYQPNSPYSASKAASDHFVRAYGQTYGISYTLSHCSNNYGPRQHSEKLIPKVIENLLEEKPIPIYGDGSNVRDWLFVEDHARAIWLILCYALKGNCYAIGGVEEMSNLTLVKKIIALVSEELSFPAHHLERLIAFVKDRPGHDFRYSLDASKIHNELGWKPLYTIEEGLKETVSYYLGARLGVF